MDQIGAKFVGAIFHASTFMNNHGFLEVYFQRTYYFQKCISRLDKIHVFLNVYFSSDIRGCGKLLSDLWFKHGDITGWKLLVFTSSVSF